MKAIIASEPGGPQVLRLVDVADPEPGPDDLLVRVGATAVNRADLLQRRGLYPPPAGASEVLGLELAGQVVALGERVSGWSVGDHVCAVVAGGGYAELAAVPARTALPLPEGLDVVRAAAVPEVFTTAYDNLCVRGRLAQGETALIHGGSGGVGTAAIQLARRQGTRVLATAGSRAKLEVCRDLGADAAIDYRREDVVERALELTEGRGVDVILDVVGGAGLPGNLRTLAVEGRLVVIGLMGGTSAEVDLRRMLTRRLTITASTLRARSLDEKAALADAMRRAVWPGFARSELRPVIDRVLPLGRAADAHAAMEAGEHIGKIVLTLAEAEPEGGDW